MSGGVEPGVTGCGSGSALLPPSSPARTTPVPPPPRSGRSAVRVRTAKIRTQSVGSRSPGREGSANASPDLAEDAPHGTQALRDALQAERALRAAAERKVVLLEENLRRLTSTASAPATSRSLSDALCQTGAELLLGMETLGIGDMAGPRGSARSAVRDLRSCPQCAAREAESPPPPSFVLIGHAASLPPY